MKNSTLKKIIQAEYLRSILVPLVVIKMMLLVAYFWSNSYVNEVTQKTLIEETKINVEEISKRTAENLNLEFKEIAAVTQIFAQGHKEFFKTFNPAKIDTSNGNYFITDTKVISNKRDIQERCTLFFSNVKKHFPNKLEKAIGTEVLDSFYNTILHSNRNIAQVYFNSFDSMNRLCPFMEDALTQYPHDIDIPKYNFYYLADKVHNPEKKVVWTEAYLDPAGQGWMISAIAPVYKEEFLEGVVGIDVTIDKLITNMLSIKLPYESSAMLVDESGNILAMNSSLESILGIKELKKHEYDAPVTTTISKPKDFNLFTNNNPVSKFVAHALKQKENIAQYDSAQDAFLLTINTIEQTKWKLLLFLDKKSLLKSSQDLKEMTYMIGYFAIAGMILFYLIFLGWVARRAYSFSRTILKPINELIFATTKMQDSLEYNKFSQTPIVEFNALLDNFTEMRKKLKEIYANMDKKIKSSIEEIREKDKHILQQSRQAQMGEMISMIAHQWRQPLSAISTVVAGLKLKEALGKYDLNTKEGQIEHKKNLGESLNKIEEYVRFLTTTIDDFRNFFKPDKKREEIYLVELVNKTLEIIGKALEVNQITVHVENESKVKVNTYANEVMQVILNVLKNSEDVFKEKKIENAYIKIRIKSEEGYEKIEIEDNAGGIPEDIIDKIFEPYFSTKQEKNGTGLGLYMSKTIIEDHCGGIIKASNTGKGALFSISLKGMEND